MSESFPRVPPPPRPSAIDGHGQEGPDGLTAQVVRWQLSGLMEAELATALGLAEEGGARRLVQHLCGRNVTVFRAVTELRVVPWMREEGLEVIR